MNGGSDGLKFNPKKPSYNDKHNPQKRQKASGFCNIIAMEHVKSQVGIKIDVLFYRRSRPPFGLLYYISALVDKC